MTIRYSSHDRVATSIPLGGIGCGALQIFPDGTRGLFTGLNNWEQPLGRLHTFRTGTAEDFRHANPFGLFVEWQGRRVAKLLQQSPIAGCPTVDASTLEADFPLATISIRDADIPLHVSLTHWSPFIPHETKESALPVVVSVIRVTNPLSCEVTVGLLACCLNVIGKWNVGRYNRIVKRPGLIGIECLRRGSDPRDERQGEMVLMVEGASSVEVTAVANTMYAAEPFRANWEDRRLEVWERFAAQGRVQTDATIRRAAGELDEPMGALAVRYRLKARETREVVFYSTWVMPNHVYGHQYSRWFDHASEVATYVHRRRAPLFERTQRWHRTIREAGLPEWLADGLINSLPVYTAASWWTRDGRFALYENPIKWPLMDSLDVRYYGTLPLTFWFPALEHSTLLQFAKAQRADGRIPHDLGKAQLDCPSDGTTAGKPWKDLATKFALMAYRDALWTNDRRFLKRIYPHVKRAMEWEWSTDRNGDGLPDNEGLDSTYDLWPFYGASAYTASIFLAAVKASERLAKLAGGDEAFARRCRAIFKRGAASFERKLWTGSYYRAASLDDGSTYEACIAGQLNGQWYAHLLDLGYLVSPESVKQAVRTMLSSNGRVSEFGAVNAVFPDGRIDDSSWHAGNIWVGETYALAALAIYEGFIEEGLELTKKMWMLFVEEAKSPWSQPDVVGRNGQLGDGELYIRNLAIWAVPMALARSDARLRRMFTALAPQLPLRAGRQQAATACVCG